jgi:hypothetical protein
MNALPKIRHTHVLCFIVLERFFLWFRFLGRRGSVRLGTFLLAFAATSISPDVISFQVFGAHTLTNSRLKSAINDTCCPCGGLCCCYRESTPSRSDHKPRTATMGIELAQWSKESKVQQDPGVRNFKKCKDKY